jgi:uncharacterized RDD family membrane protein YckC
MMAQKTPEPAQHAPIIMGEYAGFITRLLAFVIDAFIVSAAIGIVGLVANFLSNFFRSGEWAQVFVTLVVLSVSLLIYIAYYVGLWVFAGQTVGKALFGLRVISADGERVHIRQAFIRLGGYWLSALFLFFGYLISLVDDQRRCLHDRLAGTLVVYSRNVGDSFRAQSGALGDRARLVRRARMRTP